MADKFLMVKNALALILLTIALVLFGNQSASAAQEPAQTFTFDGRAYGDANATTPLLDVISIKIQILSPAQDCILYEETQSINTTASNGYFTINVGSAPSATKRSANDSNHSMALVFSNTQASIAGKLLSNGGACTYVPANGENRYIRMQMTTQSDGVTNTISPNMALDSVPSAWVAERAETLQGLTPNQLLRVNSATASLSQANLENIFSTTNYPRLNTMLSVPPASYVQTGSNGSAALPSIAGNPGSGLAAGQIWYDSSANLLKYYDGSVKTVGTSGGSVSSITTGTGLTGGPITTSGTLSVDVGTGANQIVQMTASSKLPAVDGSLLTNFNSAQITSGTLGVSRGGTGAVSFAANAAIISNGTGNAMQALNCTLNQVLAFNVTGAAVCKDVSAVFSGFVNGGNTFGATASIGNSDNFDLQFKTNNSTRMIISASGSVGVGTSNPVQLFSVGDSAQATSDYPTYNIPRKAQINDIYSNTAAGQFSTMSIFAQANAPSASSSVDTALQVNNSIPVSQTVTYGNKIGVRSLVQNNGSGTAGGLVAGQFAGVNNSAGSVTTINTLSGNSNNALTGTVTNTYGVSGNSNNQNTGTITNAYGIAGTAHNYSSGTIGTATGLYSYIYNDSASGIISTAYGLYLGKTNAGTITNNFGIYQADTATNYFAGNVGIGSTTPPARLTVSAAVPVAGSRPTGGIYFTTPNNNMVNGQIGLVQSTSEGNHYLMIQTVEDLVAWRNIVLARDGGSVGIGTANPTARLDVSGTINATSSITSSSLSAGGAPVVDGDNRYGILSYDTSNTTANVGSGIAFGGKYNVAGNVAGWAGINGLKENATSGNYSGYLTFTTRSFPAGVTERMRIDSTGNVGIGTTTPQATLDVNGYAKLKGNSSAPVACDVAHGGSIALNSSYVPCICNGTAWYYLDSLRSGAVACVW